MMLKRIINCPRPNSAIRTSLRLATLLLLSVQFVHSSNAQALSDGPSLAQSSPQPQNTERQGTQEVTTLELGKPLERELAGGQKHSYQIAMQAGQYAKVMVEQRGIDVVVRLLGSDGKAIVEFDADPRKQGEEIVESAAKTAGSYRLTVEARQRNAPPGRYEIYVTELRAATEKDYALDEARRLNTETIRLWRADKHDEALPLAERALAIRERALGAEHPDTGTSVATLANLYADKGDYARAESLYLRALEIKEKALGKDHISLSPILNNLGNLYKDKGDYTGAESAYGRALEIREKALEPDHLLIASVLNNLAIVSRLKGDEGRAASLYQRTLEIREKALGPEHPDVATTLNNLANLYSDPAKSEPLYRRALAIREKVLGPEHSDVAQTLYNLAVMFSSTGDYAQAAPLCRRALSIFEKALGSEHPYTSYPLNLLAVIYKNTGDYAQAESLYQRAITIKEKAQGQYHPDLGGTLSNLANLYALKGEIDKAVSTQARANAILEYNIALNLMTGSERQKLAYLKTLSDLEDQTLTLHFRTAPGSVAAADLAATTILQRKGRVLDSMSDSLGALRRRFNRQDQVLLDDLNNTTTRLVGFVLDGPQNITSDEHRQKIRALEEQREKLESEISRRSAGFYEQSRPVTLKVVQEAIPGDAVLVEFAIYRPISPKAYEFASERALDPRAVGDPRYVAYIVRAQGVVQGKDLGPVKGIDEALAAYRQALRDPQRKDVRDMARAVDEKLMQPVRALLGEATHVLISPDGELNLIPFTALVDEQGRYLIERYSFTYLTSGRDLLRLQVARQSRSRPLVVANPSFGEPAPQLVARTGAAPRSTPRGGGRRRSITNARDLSEVYFAPLSGTAQEARTIQALFPEANLLIGEQATKSSLRQAAAPRLLHIATHGFFLQDTGSPDTTNVQVARRAINANTRIENPLLRSGLALAGANLRQGGNSHDDGILTALEAAGLNLWGTKLVVLSACDTGLGEVRNGEGVYGLRRAFVLAGAESLVMSLWPVSDYTTRELMTNYYKNLKQGMGRGAALRRVQLEMLKRNPKLHPFYWANFIQSGEWANLNGQR